MMLTCRSFKSAAFVGKGGCPTVAAACNGFTLCTDIDLGRPDLGLALEDVTCQGFDRGVGWGLELKSCEA